MAAAQLLKVTNTIDNRVAGIADDVLIVDSRVAGIDDRVADVDERVAGVDDRVACVDDRVKGVDNRVKAVDDKVAAVNDGTQSYLLSVVAEILTHSASRCKKGRGSYATSSRRLGRRHRSSETFVISEPH